MNVLLLLFPVILWVSSVSAAENHQYNRIISLYSAHTENLVSLGAGDQLIGISNSDDYPAEILEKPRFSYKQDSERFIAVQPDLILIRPMLERAAPEMLKQLRKAGITIVSLQPTSVNGIFDYWKKLGRLTGKEENSYEMIESFKKGLTRIAENVSTVPHSKRPRVYFEAIHKKMKTFAPESIAMFVLEQAGGINIADDATQMRKTNIAAYGKEHILSKANDIDVFIAQHGRMNPVTQEMIKQETGFMAIKAVREDRVFLIEEQLASRPTLRILEGIQMMNSILYRVPSTD